LRASEKAKRRYIGKTMSNNNEFIKPPITILAFGCNHYENLGNLKGVQSDINRIRDIFCGDNDYALFDEEDFIELFNASSADLRNEIKKYIINRSAEGDVLIIYFGGHGTAIGRDNFGFCMSDAYVHPEEKFFLPTSVVTIKEIISSLYIKSVFPIFLIDSCYCGQIAKQLKFSFSEMSLEISKNLVGTFASDFGFLTVTDAITPTGDDEDGGILSKTLEDICKQGFGEIDSQRKYITVAKLFKSLIKSIKNNGTQRAKSFFPSGQIADYEIIRNVQYFSPEVPENRYSFTSIYKLILDALWNDGNEDELNASEILEITRSQSAYGNHRKLSYTPWDLIEDNPDSNKRRLTERGKDFIKGEIEIPKVVIVNQETQECRPQKNSPMISYSDL